MNSVPVQVTRTRLQDFAEIVGQRCDKAEPTAGLGDPHIASRATALIIQVQQRKSLGKPRPHHRKREVLIKPAFPHVAKRHDLDQRQVHALAVGPRDQFREFIFVDALQRHRVDLDLKASVLRGLDAVAGPCRVRPTA